MKETRILRDDSLGNQKGNLIMENISLMKMRRGTTGNADIDLLSSVPLSLVRV
ncbi:hypothetical protein J6590_087945 [Homalodisca vitripennis]|nr:hypothetical protein J6590_086434 [Homalodisca vitripennis]KAG8295102.1 hypothetical protein J6590_087945 [Homalodisca vitripennis]